MADKVTMRRRTDGVVRKFSAEQIAAKPDKFKAWEKVEDGTEGPLVDGQAEKKPAKKAKTAPKTDDPPEGDDADDAPEGDEGGDETTDADSDTPPAPPAPTRRSTKKNSSK